jgi:adenylate cyclase
VAQELGVRYILEGSVRKAGNRVRITGQLIDTATGAHIWAERFDGALEDIFDLQDQVASRVAGAIEPKLRQSEIERAIRKPTESLDAYDLYLRALTLRDKHTDESVAEAIALLKRALTIDGNYAPAKALIGWSRIHQLSHGRTPLSEVDRAEAIAFAKEALEARSDDPDTLWMAGFSLLSFAGERAVAATAIDRALTLNPNSAHAWMAHGHICLFDQQYQSAIEALERAMRLSPFDSLRRAFTNGTSLAHLRSARYEEALTWAERTLSEEPGYRGALLSKTLALVQLNRIEEAAETLHRVVDSQPGLTIARYKASWAHAVPPDVLASNVEALRKAGLPEG